MHDAGGLLIQQSVPVYAIYTRPTLTAVTRKATSPDLCIFCRSRMRWNRLLVLLLTVVACLGQDAG